MDKVTLIDKGIDFTARFAAPSILTGYFVAAIVDSNVEDVSSAFANPGRILVHNMEDHYSDVTYTGYTRINEMRTGANEITVILDKGVS